ncbi:phospholipase A1-like isoform X2 [Sipha flava]|uniref:Phospholipase A1-like isoform X2 n=1 Tax=Sipha flava TaxID=143950 RepID=A0A8B8F6Q4_9HEMI|nr:phospholipase A1-like isoform X2 [Sipha flava]
MKIMKKKLVVIETLVLILINAFINNVSGVFFGSNDISYWRCKIKQSFHCPNPDVTFYLYTRRRMKIDMRNKRSLYNSSWDPNKKNVIIIHGFNGAENNKVMVLLRNAYLERGDFNVFMVDWSPLTVYPCYLSSLRNSRLVGQCSAQLYAYLIYSGISKFQLHCVGHSLGAHICGMISNHLTEKQHKIIGLDPAKPLIDLFLMEEFRLTKNDADFVEVIHTNSGAYGENPQIGHVDFSINGGRMQPSCIHQPNIIKRSRCSHFKSVCYFASSLSKRGNKFLGLQCTETCDMVILPKGSNRISLLPMGIETPVWARGTFYVAYDDPDNFCRYDE